MVWKIEITCKFKENKIFYFISFYPYTSIYACLLVQKKRELRIEFTHLYTFFFFFPSISFSSSSFYRIRKILNTRLFTGDGKDWNKSVVQVDYEVLLVSQFTLYPTLISLFILFYIFIPIYENNEKKRKQ